MDHDDDRGAGRRSEPRADFERLFRAHYAQILAFALRRLGDRALAEEAAAETFAVLWRRRADAPEPALPWLYGVATRVIANQRRSRQRRASLERRLEAEPTPGLRERDPLERIEGRAQLLRAFALLSEPEREVLRLIAWEDLTPREAAAVLGCTYGAFRVRFHRAKRKLAKHLAAAGHSTGEGRATTNPAEEAG
ncbi:MAG TPA: sigma-70 family RNA polymerase sigma factor [Solirubrobacterales bacterium]|nr:sigma-70 family RNA polymerase sigma factor [Solirubrobacterales bacterium]